jgi:uncharacterized surface protein with fasciclin (FAS1) repeats
MMVEVSYREGGIAKARVAPAARQFGTLGRGLPIHGAILDGRYEADRRALSKKRPGRRPVARREELEVSKNIVETAREAGSFTTLLAAVDAAGLGETLAGGGPFTVFAPSDEAFAKLPAGTVESLLADPAKLTDVLTYHVVAGRVTASDAAGLLSAPTVQGSDLPISIDGGVHVGDANVVSADIEASNGVIHVIDRVLLPAAA